MRCDSKNIEILNNLGLTNYESQVYVTLLSEGIVSAKDICDVCGIPYGKVYEVINNLALKGFVHTLPTKPRRYKSVAPSEALKIVKQEFNQKLKDAETHLNRFNQKEIAEKQHINQKATFWVLNGRSAICKKMENVLSRAKKQVNVYTTSNGFKRMMFYSELINKLQDNGVKIKVLIGDNGNVQDIKKLSAFSTKCRVQNHFISVDGNEIILFESSPDNEDVKFGRDTGIWAISTPLTSMMDLFFEQHLKQEGMGAKQEPIFSGMGDSL